MAPPATRPRNDRRLSLRVGFIICSPVGPGNWPPTQAAIIRVDANRTFGRVNEAPPLSRRPGRGRRRGVLAGRTPLGRRDDRLAERERVVGLAQDLEIGAGAA